MSIRSLQCVGSVPIYMEQFRALFAKLTDCLLHRPLMSDHAPVQAVIYEICACRMFLAGSIENAKNSMEGEKKIVHTYRVSGSTGDLLVETNGKSPASFRSIATCAIGLFYWPSTSLSQAWSILQFEFREFWLARLGDTCTLLCVLNYATFFILYDHLQPFRFRLYVRIMAKPTSLPFQRRRRYVYPCEIKVFLGRVQKWVRRAVAR